ncbi:MAG: metal-binding protein [Pseudomonadales bacterium]|jgi:hypothetical protein|uniref:DUF411 domain-containing protein n=1 Tax=Halopseudomonas TaxID=2901189 RepID=UPI000C46783A|nr:DUF411 domain-containing protein [Halopseudomonas aestusnigri]MAH01201.1 metal-binding protein [Pseudomonadales bacterium]HBT57891.1 metal-binding protein [Pseudomonas sp.]MAK75215.1 metal-binding protein [Pseudomonadales bacterium]MAP76763.1 metal-binding protein [Pseudomonadales bacterium]MAS66087.1 metal-binding protein [Pseudomonadales bacterium]|tara:strand:- start:10180 stop:10599 length:420 start_codon:yes stop_codon:yes gene_type:complete
MKNLIAGGLLLVSSLSQAADIDVYRDPSCGCCHAWIEHLEENGLEVNDHVTSEVVAMKQSLGVDPALRSCHTAIYKGVFIEGHVPASDILALEDDSTIKGLAVPGMPIGSPGMEMGERHQAYQVIAVEADGSQRVYSQH